MLRRSLSREQPRERLRVVVPPSSAECYLKIDGHRYAVRFAPDGFAAEIGPNEVRMPNKLGNGEFAVAPAAQ